MNTRAFRSFAGALVMAVALAAAPVLAGEYHAGDTNVCSDCHTMHFSMQHNWDGTTPVATTPQPDGNWLGTTGPNAFLLKAPVNQLCLSCHDGQTFAPDVFEANTNAYQREAGGLNETGAAPYESWKGHTLGSTAVPPGNTGTPVYDATAGLECTSCHVQHGSATRYRNLKAVSRSLPVPTYSIGVSNDLTKDVWINVATPYTGGTGSSATFGPYFSQGNVNFNRIDANKSTSSIGAFCASCHGNFHGAPGDSTVGASLAVVDGFIRHPTAGTTIGLSGSQGHGGHSSLSRFVANTTKVHVLTSDYTGYTDASPTCISCHKGHGNQNPFGLIFMNRDAAAVNEQGGYATGQTVNTEIGYRNLCGQCHGQGA